MNEEKRLSIEQVEYLQANGGIIVDLRPADEFADFLIPKSLNIELNNDFTEIAAYFIFQDQLMALICEDGKEEESLTRLEAMGFSNIAGFLGGGINRWINGKRKLDVVINVDCEELDLEMKYGSPNICDIRLEPDYIKSHISEAENIEAFLFIENNDLLDNKLQFYMYCQNGRLSMSLISYLKTHGIHNIYHLSGGFEKAAAFPGFELASGK